jgi:hypothetical protein
LLAWDRHVVGVNCVTKSIPASPTARAKSETVDGGVPVFSDPDMKGLQQVWRLGTGVLLVRASVLKQLPKGAWEMKYIPEKDVYQGEDWTFCECLEALSIPIFVDHGLSQLVGHEGMLEYTHELVGTVQQSG